MSEMLGTVEVSAFFSIRRTFVFSSGFLKFVIPLFRLLMKSIDCNFGFVGRHTELETGRKSCAWSVTGFPAAYSGWQKYHAHVYKIEDYKKLCGSQREISSNLPLF